MTNFRLVFFSHHRIIQAWALVLFKGSPRHLLRHQSSSPSCKTGSSPSFRLPFSLTSAVHVRPFQCRTRGCIINVLTNSAYGFSALIAGRIWWIHRRTKGAVSGSNLVPAAVVVIESGGIYSACLIILLSLYLSGSFAQYIVLDAVSH